MMASKRLKECNACGIQSCGTYSARKMCRECENVTYKKCKPNQDAVKSPTIPKVDLQSNAIEMICRAAEIVDADYNVSSKTNQKSCRDCRVMKLITNFPIKDGASRRGPICRQCELRARNLRKCNGKSSKRIGTSISKMKTCSVCDVAKPLSDFYYSGSDSKCKKCRADYNRQSRDRAIRNRQPPNRQNIDDLVTSVCQDIKTAQEQVDAILATPIRNPTTRSIEIGRPPSHLAMGKGIVRIGDEIVDKFGRDTTASRFPQPNHPDSELQMSIVPDASNTFRGLEKFDQIELVGVIAKVFHLSIVELKCVYPNESVLELGAWKDQVRELYAEQNLGADESYRHIMFDYVRAARELKNGTLKVTPMP